MIHTHAGLARYDITVAQWAADHATPQSTRLLRLSNRAGSTEFTLPIVVIAAVVASQRLRQRAVLEFVTAVYVGQIVLVNITKWLVDRARPQIDQLSGFAGPSFPSGHAACAAASYATLAYLLGRRRRRTTKALLAGMAGGIAGAVAATRVALGVHWVTDVIAGLAMGWAWFALVSVGFGGRVLHFGAPAAVGRTIARNQGSAHRTSAPPT